jgi:hypothetical protein
MVGERVLVGVAVTVAVGLLVGVLVMVAVSVFVGVEVGVLVGEEVGVLLGVAVKVEVQGVPWLFWQGVLVMVKVFVGAGGGGAVGLLFLGQPAMNMELPAKTDIKLKPRIRNFITNLQFSGKYNR